MTTVVFVHGTGVRQPRYSEALSIVTRAVTGVRPDAQIRGCYWGERLGARLSAQGASIPPVVGSRALPGPDDLTGVSALPGTTDVPGASGPLDDPVHGVEDWWLLYLDPTVELRSLALLATAGPGAATALPPPGRLTPGELLREQARAALAGPAVVVAAERAGLAGTLPAATEAILTHPDTGPALDEPAASGAGARLLSRAVVAEAVRRLSDPPADPPAIDGRSRDDLVTALATTIEPGTDSRAVSAAIADILAATGRLAWRLQGARLVERRRAAILGSTHPASGDVLVYLAHGQQIRAFIADQVRACPEPPVLLAHSLGGVACVDLLVQQPQLRVASLITVGSQVPFLYELGALPSLRPPDRLPGGFPPWVNVYDPRDLLAYVGAEVFPGQVRDVPVESRQPFPHSHSAYWVLPAFASILDAELPPEPVSPA